MTNKFLPTCYECNICPDKATCVLRDMYSLMRHRVTYAANRRWGVKNDSGRKIIFL